MSKEYGPGHPCPYCQAEVQMYTGGRSHFSRLTNAGTMELHRCNERWAYLEDVGDYRGCFCGQDIYVVQGVKYETDSETLHECSGVHWWTPYPTGQEPPTAEITERKTTKEPISSRRAQSEKRQRRRRQDGVAL